MTTQKAKQKLLERVGITPACSQMPGSATHQSSGIPVVLISKAEICNDPRNLFQQTTRRRK